MSNRNLQPVGRSAVLAGAAALVLLAATIGIGSSLLAGGPAAIVEEPQAAAAEPQRVDPVKVEPAAVQLTADDKAGKGTEGEISAETPVEQMLAETAGQSPSAAPLPAATETPEVALMATTMRGTNEAADSQKSDNRPAAAETASPVYEVAVVDPAPVQTEPAAAPVAPAAAPVVPATAADSGFANIPAYQQINPDVQGWLKIPGTNIDYPVLFNATDVNYYLEKDLYRQYSRNGVIWADPATIFGNSATMSRNTVLYGHNWTNYSASPRIGSSSDVMFAQLTQYHYLDFTRQHPFIYYSTAYEEMQWVVFACFYTDVNFIYNYADPDDYNFAGIVNGARARSRHIIDVDVSYGDKILTLSTCTRAYGKSDRQRFVVMARQVRPGETFGEIAMATNPSPVLPQL